MPDLSKLNISSQNDLITFAINGQAYSITSTSSFSDTNETNVMVITNPSSSTISARAIFFYCGVESTQGSLTVRFYSDATITNNGTDVSSIIMNNYCGNATNPTSKIVPYAAPTTSARGNKRISLVFSANTSSQPIDFKQAAILAPGSHLLMSVQASNMGLLSSITGHFFLEWVEA